jgi:hypothetical protein
MQASSCGVVLVGPCKRGRHRPHLAMFARFIILSILAVAATGFRSLPRALLSRGRVLQLHMSDSEKKQYNDPNNSVFVGNLPFTVTEEDFKAFLDERVGIPAQSIFVARGKDTGELFVKSGGVSLLND